MLYYNQRKEIKHISKILKGGIKMKKVAEIKTIKRLENHPGANCTIIEFDNGNVNFISYSTKGNFN